MFALRSHERALAAAARGDFHAEVVPRDVAGRLAATDEPPRAHTTLERLAALKPVFDAAGSVTAGNSSPLNDGAAALVLASASAAARLGATPLARVRAFACAAVAPRDFGIAPVPAIRRLLEHNRVESREVAHVELNEAFAAQVLNRELRIDHERLNPLGGAIALGHPLGCSGARIVVTLVHALRRRGGGLGVASLCIAVGQGLATLVESG
jgi:acetyl-CoA acetyltransferase family protein